MTSSRRHLLVPTCDPRNDGLGIDAVPVGHEHAQLKGNDLGKAAQRPKMGDHGLVRTCDFQARGTRDAATLKRQALPKVNWRAAAKRPAGFRSHVPFGDLIKIEPMARAIEFGKDKPLLVAKMAQIA